MTTAILNSEAPATSPIATIAAEPAPPANSADNASRCHFRYPNGRRCVLPGLPAKSGFCLRHYNRQAAAGLPLVPTPDDSADLSTELLPELSESSSPVDLRQFLARLLVLLTKGRITTRRAAVLTYITSQLLHSTPPPKQKLAPDSLKSSLLRLARSVADETKSSGAPQ